MKGRRRAWAFLIGLALLTAPEAAKIAGAQDVGDALLAPQPGEQATVEELRAFRMFQMRKYVRARELAAKVVEDNPRSVVGHFVLALVHRYGEANFPRALYHAERALTLFEATHGTEPAPTEPWAWRMRLLQELAFVHGDLEHHEQKLFYLGRYNEAYDPDLIAEQAWPLMKMGRYDAARRVAKQALSLPPEGPDSERQQLVALNAMCAIEFEAGNDGVSYEACQRALARGEQRPGGASVVDYTNFAEAARSLFRLDEAERVGLDATKATVSWYGNPWLELSELYLREGRFAESLAALREMNDYIKKRPPHARNADLHERWRATAAFLLVVGRSEQALRTTDKAVIAPDRSAFRSRDAEQDQAVMALLHRRALLVETQRLREHISARSWFQDFFGQLSDWATVITLRLRAWASAREVAKALRDPKRLIGTFRIGTAASGIMPPWLAGELVDVLGAGVVRSAVKQARRQDQRQGASAYYDAFLSEVALASGNLKEATSLAEGALQSLGPSEALLRARVLSVLAIVAEKAGESGVQLGRRVEAAFQVDPGVFRRRGRAIPVTFSTDENRLSRDAVARLSRSPSFRAAESGLTVHAAVAAAGGRVCLRGQGGAVLACSELRPETEEAPSALVTRLVDRFHRDAFAPRIDLSQADIHSLDGSNRVGHDLLDDVAGLGEP